MTTISRGTGIFLLLLSSALSSKAGDLPRSSPEAQGIPSAGLLRLVEALDGEIDAMHSLMILRHGQVIAEGWWAPYTASSPHVLYSLSKSFTSTAVGLAIAEGKLDLSDPVASFFPDALPPGASENLQAMRIRDLLTMSTGHQDEPPTSPAEMSAASFLTHPVPHKPGTHFRYNTAATFMLSAIVQKVSGETVLDYLQPRLFDPLGIGAPVWDTNFEGISLGGYGLRVRTEDIAKFGQLYLQTRPLGRQATAPREMGRAGGLATDVERQQPTERLGARLRVPILALPPQRVPGRRCLRAILRRHARAGYGRGDHQRHEKHAGDPRAAVEASPAHGWR